MTEQASVTPAGNALAASSVPDSSVIDSPKVPRFELDLEVFSGPLDLLLTLIIKNKLDITEVALAQVTDEFIAYMQAFPDLSQASQFLEIAATLLNIKASQLLPGEEAEELDPEYLEARDLLFSR